ncbi:hypothetical protein MTO96_033372 [Rhipicephalus appendiculatus]
MPLNCLCWMHPKTSSVAESGTEVRLDPNSFEKMRLPYAFQLFGTNLLRPCSSDATKTWAEQDEDEPDKDDDKDDEKSSSFPHPMLEDTKSSMCKAKRTVEGNNSALSFLF